ncbi:MAG: hypothetical protein ACPL25_11090, partial [Ignavibacteria bacterium]
MKFIYLKALNIVLLLLFLFPLVSPAQQILELKSKYNSLGKFWVATFEGGVTLPLSDFQKPSIGYLA